MIPAKMIWEAARGMSFERFMYWYNAMIKLLKGDDD
jgi:hypothetical protein